ncbi:lactoylglutathione lyase [Thioalkalivibrio sp. AKL12]|uniref:lactoylglutathione lyase n=1 Tax=Thioalkalivibrio sp. AKL12 TaxID=1158159 RepID=UPI000369F0E2|nr:lactoylglutathione lyase [Thioalkalivibrio sp. AKL12]
MSDNPTAGFRFNHTMLRVKDPQKALDFYQRVFGMELVKTLDFPEFEFTLYFLAQLGEDEPQPPKDAGEATRWMFSQRGILELTYNYGTENDADFHYHDGNEEPQGFGHICFSVPDLDAAVRWFDQNNVEFVKRPDEGGLKDIAFVKDLDGYWIEILEPGRLTGLGR